MSEFEFDPEPIIDKTLQETNGMSKFDLFVGNPIQEKHKEVIVPKSDINPKVRFRMNETELNAAYDYRQRETENQVLALQRRQMTAQEQQEQQEAFFRQYMRYEQANWFRWRPDDQSSMNQPPEINM